MSKDQKSNKFEDLRSEKGLIAEFLEFFWHNKKFWMIPIVVVLLLLGLLIILSGSSVAPYIYTLF